MEKQEYFLIKKGEPSTLCVSGSPFKIVFNFPTTQKATF